MVVHIGTAVHPAGHTRWVVGAYIMESGSQCRSLGPEDLSRLSLPDCAEELPQQQLQAELEAQGVVPPHVCCAVRSWSWVVFPASVGDA